MWKKNTGPPRRGTSSFIHKPRSRRERVTYINRGKPEIPTLVTTTRLQQYVVYALRTLKTTSLSLAPPPPFELLSHPRKGAFPTWP